LVTQIQPRFWDTYHVGTDCRRPRSSP
jgi:hypothetical protein